jgi:hypothetical protein
MKNAVIWGLIALEAVLVLGAFILICYACGEML